MMSNSNTRICKDFLAELDLCIGSQPDFSVFILVDENTAQCCLPTLMQSPKLATAQVLTIESGDSKKNIDSAVKIWEFLSTHGATRKSLLINVGGGVITDIGGFAASTFKRGMRYINVSTTLLGAVDAATGGKTGINFLGLKNEIGVFAPADAVLINVDFFKTIDLQNLYSGYAEMVKHALIDTRAEWDNTLNFDLEQFDMDDLRPLLAKNIAIKERVVDEDPHEMGIRKALNLGHTFGHAFESLSYKINSPVLHGYAVMWGLLCELYLSHMKLGFPKDDLLRLKYLSKEFYGTFNFDCSHYDALLELMTHDKKNDSKEINFTLLQDVGVVKINQHATKDEIFECLDFLRDG